MKTFFLLIWVVFASLFMANAQESYKIVGQLDKKVQGIFVLMADSHDGPIKLGEARVKKVVLSFPELLKM